MGFFSRWASFQDGLLFEMVFLSRWASFRDGLPFEMGVFSRWSSFRDGRLFEILLETQEVGFFSRWKLQILKLTTIKQWARLLHKLFSHEICLNVKLYSRKSGTSLFTVLMTSCRCYFYKVKRGASFRDGLHLEIKLTGLLFDVLQYYLPYAY